MGYDGGRIVAERLADHVVVVRSDYIPRIQEVQASIYHVLRGASNGAWPEPTWNWRYRMRYVLLIVGGLMILVGGVWLLQGTAYCPVAS